MLKSLKGFFKSQDDIKQPTDHDLKLAAATLMFEVIRSDGQIDDVEMAYMREILQREFKLSDDELDTLSQLAKKTSRDTISLQGFTREICESWDNPKRMKLLEHLWTLALADEKIDPHERHFVRKIAGLLYLNDKQIVVAREHAKQQLGINTF